MTAVSAYRAVRSRVRRRVLVITLVLVALVLALLLTALCVGVPVLSPGEVLATLAGAGDSSFTVTRLRLPRALLGGLVGAALGVSGALLQTTARNPLASPDLLGITGGASVGAVIALLTLGLSGAAVQLAALAGALLAAVAIVALSWRRGVSGYRVVLIGIGIAFMAQGIVNYLLSRSEVRDAQGALAWLVGSLDDSDIADVVVIAVALAVLAPLTAVAAPRLAMLQLGDDAARALGIRPDAVRLAALLLVVGLAAAGTSVAGPVAFVAFVAAPIARRLVGAGRLALPQAGLVGAVVVLAGDLIGQYAVPGIRVPVGVVTALVGAPYLMWLLASSNRRGRGA